MLLRVVESELLLRRCDARLPFRFGVHTMTAAPLALLRVVVETEGGERAEGCASDLLVPKWFRKDVDRPIAEDFAELIAAAQAARGAAEALGTAPLTAFDLWWSLYETLIATAPPDPAERLVRGFGVALLERAVIDAACRAAETTFARALRGDLLGLDPGRADPDLAGWRPADDLAPPLETILVRHTVGLVDPLRRSDVTPGERIDDGLPMALEEDVAAYGLRAFKLKVSGDASADRARLLAIAEVLDEACAEPPRITLDGNEQYGRIEDLEALVESLRGDERGARLLSRLVAIEQPLPRDRTFDAARHDGIDRLSRVAPLLIDEADVDLDSFPRAVALGYRGVSVKNCKGVFRAIVNFGRCCGRAELFQTGEDLTNLAVIALQQDLATASCLGLDHVERNGHHYFRGLDHLGPRAAEAAIAAHGDIYERRSGLVTLRIDGGALRMASIHRAGFGYDVPIDREGWMPAEAWSWSEA